MNKTRWLANRRSPLLVVLCVLSRYCGTGESLYCPSGDEVSDEFLCDGINDCYDDRASDECGCDDTVYDVCLNGRCVLESNICDGINDCEDGLASDEIGCLGGANDSEVYMEYMYTIPCSRRDAVRCGNEEVCIKATQLCDANYDCPDESDEIFGGPGFKCIVKSTRGVICTLPQPNLYDDTAQCVDNMDICFDSNGLLNQACFQCMDGENIISEYQVCDGILDCKDFSDECLCEEIQTPSVCHDIYSPVLDQTLCTDHMQPEYSTEEENRWIKGVYVKCGDGICIPTASICNGEEECETGEDEDYCYSASMLEQILNLNFVETNGTLSVSEIANRTTSNDTMLCNNDLKGMIVADRCDGRPTCDELVDECIPECDDQPPYCQVDLSCVWAPLICDGEWNSDRDCEYGRIPEEELGCPERFYCKSGESISIDITQVCDGMINCDDESDESKDRMCDDDRFYCETRENTTSSKNPLFVPKTLVFNGRTDCADGSDECPSTLDASTFSSREEMIANTGLKAILWIIGPTALIGNIAVLGKTIMKFRRKKNMNIIAKSHHVMIGFLSVADGLMGLYLVILCAASTAHSGKFCLGEKSWKSGTLCQVMGSLVLFSSEASVFILIIMGIFRFYTVFRPFETQFSNKSFRYMLVGIVISLVTAFIVAFLPWVLDFFVTHTYYVGPFFGSDVIEQQTFDNFVARLNTAVQRTNVIANGTLHVIKNTTINGRATLAHFVTQRIPSTQPMGYYGFFSQNSICLPSFFTRIGQPGWQYSIALVTLNFVIFILMVTFYALISHLSDTKRTKELRSNRPKGSKLNFQRCKLQARVTRLLVTDFVCWIPVCIMSYVNFAGYDLGNTAYAVSGIVLLPINSALNPLLYAGLADTIWKKIASYRRKSKTPGSQNGTSSLDESTRTKNTPIAMRRILHEGQQKVGDSATATPTTSLNNTPTSDRKGITDTQK